MVPLKHHLRTLMLGLMTAEREKRARRTTCRTSTTSGSCSIRVISDGKTAKVPGLRVASEEPTNRRV